MAMLVLYKHWKGLKEYHFSGRLARYNDWPQGCKMQLPSRAPQFIRLVPGKRVQQGPAAALATVDWNAFNCIPCPFCTHVGTEIQELINIQCIQCICMVRPEELTQQTNALVACGQHGFPAALGSRVSEEPPCLRRRPPFHRTPVTGGTPPRSACLGHASM